jgi:AAA domain
VKDVLSILIHGDSKAGKSTLTSTAPLPILVIDAEGSWKFINRIGFTGPLLKRRDWDPLNAPPRLEDGEFDVCHVMVNDWATLQRVYAWLSQSPHDFTSIVIDSITEAQRRLKTNISGDGIMKGYDAWGEMLVKMDALIRGFRDLTLLPGPVRCVVFVAETKEQSGKWRPAMQGQIASSLPYWVDICGYVYQSREADAEGKPTKKVIHLFVGTHASFEAGERVQGRLPDDIINPSLTAMIDTIYKEEE